ncbi:PTS system, sucrose-specific IIC component [Alkalithermobacter thermoalcaliphilus JW-YL-7 = DSM 7308]|uniref:PTS system, sucrose-specific IIC component n=1 Tax=Alkalithermobacter thermoalcaliphilus JW-YL-7 = DSM 7308 TaxID=1121328 RepID=A0A150FS14_CLOPD|nr:Protein-N(pi)-phosphohistidine--sugar phosphotransferase [[Clostridium] paradoxum JW-YL-7 = DSM 7308]SHK34588.1 PTS system, sucrose-specific IIC component [[Clostridium] paradoxum JW-YL-7 = DSM 7308]
MDSLQLSKEILKALGGKENIQEFDICATRLRIFLKDNEKADLRAIKQLKGVIAAVFRLGQVHIILGTGLVSKVYEDFKYLVSDNELDTKDIKNKNFFRRIANIFIPLIPALVGSGIIIGISNTLKNIGLVSEQSDIYKLLEMFSSSVFVFLNIFVGISAGREFGTNPMLAGVVSGILMHPMLESIGQISIFGFRAYTKVGAGGIFAVLLVVFFMSYVEKTLRKIIPNSLDLIITPATTIIITGLCAVYILSPLGIYLTSAFSSIIRFAFYKWKVVTGFLLGGVYSALVTTGLHQGLNPLYLEMLSTTGVNPILPIIAMADTAQAGAGLAVYFKSKNIKLKKISLNSVVICLLGITEPMMFGCNIPLVKPFIAGLMGGAIGGCFVAFFEVNAISLGLSSIPIISIIKQGDVLKYIVGFFIAFSTAFIGTYLMGFEDDIKIDDIKIK